MRDVHPRTRMLALAAAAALLLTGCPGPDEAAPPPDDPDVETPADLAFDIGVTEDPCPSAVNPDNGCIYLGILSDLTVGPFAPLAVPITDAQVDFWQRVNEQGGIAGFDVDVSTYTRDNEYNPEVHATRFAEIEPEVLALAQTLGTPPTLAIIDRMDAGDVVGAPASWWSGWDFEDNILQSGYNYCVEAMNGLDWAIEEYGVESVLAVHYPGDYGGDFEAGASRGAEATGVTYMSAVETLPNAVVGDQGAPVAAIMRDQPDLVMLATGPAEMAEIVGGTVARGFEGRFVGSVPTFNPALLQSPAAEAILGFFHFVAPWGPWGSDTAAHRAMQETIGEGNLPANDGYTYGWIWSYPMKALLEQAAASGDLTRAGLVAAVGQVEVDYEGALPDKRYAGDPNDTVVRESLIVQPDADAPLGSSVLRDFAVGPTAQAYDFSEPCTTF